MWMQVTDMSLQKEQERKMKKWLKTNRKDKDTHTRDWMSYSNTRK